MNLTVIILSLIETNEPEGKYLSQINALEQCLVFLMELLNIILPMIRSISKIALSNQAVDWTTQKATQTKIRANLVY